MSLIEEFRAVKQIKSSGKRLIDGVIVLGEPNEIGHWKDIPIKGKDIFQRYEMNDAFTLAKRRQDQRAVKAYEITFIK